MKKSSTLLLVVTGMSLLGIVLGLSLRSRPAIPAIVQPPTPRSPVAEAPPAVPEPSAPVETLRLTEQPGPPPSETSIAPQLVVQRTNAPTKTNAITKSRSKKPPIEDPLARVALTMVGMSGEAEAYWLEAINDASLSSHERQDLIEDLNEEGFSDPRNITADDLPLILNRIALIEELAPDAMDKVNADAFAEAYKDLVNMYGKVVQR